LRNQQPPRHSRESAAWRLKIKRILHVLGDRHPVSGKAGSPRSRRARCDRPADARNMRPLRHADRAAALQIIRK
jgi:hypothetical protein